MKHYHIHVLNWMKGQQPWAKCFFKLKKFLCWFLFCFANEELFIVCEYFATRQSWILWIRTTWLQMTDIIVWSQPAHIVVLLYQIQDRIGLFIYVHHILCLDQKAAYVVHIKVIVAYLQVRIVNGRLEFVGGEREKSECEHFQREHVEPLISKRKHLLQNG